MPMSIRPERAVPGQHSPGGVPFEVAARSRTIGPKHPSSAGHLADLVSHSSLTRMPGEIVQHIATFLPEPRDLHSFAMTGGGISDALAQERQQAKLALEAKRIQSPDDAQNLMDAIRQIGPHFRGMPLAVTVDNLRTMPEVVRPVVIDMVLAVLESLPAAGRARVSAAIVRKLGYLPQAQQRTVSRSVLGMLEKLPAQHQARFAPELVEDLEYEPSAERRVVFDGIMLMVEQLPAEQREEWLVSLGSNLWVLPEAACWPALAKIVAAVGQLPPERCAEALSMLTPYLHDLPEGHRPAAFVSILTALERVSSARLLKPLEKLVGRVRSLPAETRLGALAEILTAAERLPAKHRAELLEATATCALSFLPIDNRATAFDVFVTVLERQLPAEYWAEPLSALLGTIWSLREADRPKAFETVVDALGHLPTQNRAELQASVRPFMSLSMGVN